MDTHMDKYKVRFFIKLQLIPKHYRYIQNLKYKNNYINSKINHWKTWKYL